MPQTTSSASLCCIKTEVELARLAGETYRAIVNKDQTYGTAAAILDNSQKGLNEIMSLQKTRPGDPTCTDQRVTVKYPIPQCGEGLDTVVDLDDCNAPLATAGEQIYGYDDWTFATNVGAGFSMDSRQFDCTCETLDQQYAMTLYNEARKMYQRFNRKMIELVMASVGSTFDGIDTATTPKPLKLLYNNPQTNTVHPQPMALTDIGHQYDRMGLRSRQPIIISGSRKLDAFISTRQLFAGNEFGFNVAAAEIPGNVYLDYQLGTTAAVLGSPATNPVITLMPGTFDFIEWYKYDAAEEMIVDGRVSWIPIQASNGVTRTKVDLGPALGLNTSFVVDMQIIYDEKCNTIDVKMRKDFGFWCMPQEAFCAGDSYNGKLLWDVTCAPYQCEDVC